MMVGKMTRVVPPRRLLFQAGAAHARTHRVFDLRRNASNRSVSIQ